MDTILALNIPPIKVCSPGAYDDYNERFAKLPRNNHNAHRPLRSDENLDLIFAWREPRRVSKSLTFQFDKMLYLLADTPEHRKLAGRYIDVYHYPDGRIEPRTNGAALTFTTYDKLSEVNQGAIVDNKRLGHVLQLAQYVQEKRDNTRSLSLPATEGPPRKRGRPPGKKSQRSLDQSDMLEGLKRLQKQPWSLNGTEN